jgi:mannose-6-phosphate isomerase-like protein (cupin superfamily)
MSKKPINLSEKLKLIQEFWTPKVISEMNDYQFKLVKVRGDFVWHSHQDTDETFIVLQGTLNIEFRDRTIQIKEGEMYVVSKGQEHRPYATNECHILLIEPKGVVNTGEEHSNLRAPNNEWI